METYLPQLQYCPLFEGIPWEELPGLLHCIGSRTLHLKRGQYVFREGDAAVYIGIVLQGTLRLVREDYYGNRCILSEIGPGQIFGESYAFSAVPKLPVSVVAEENSAVMLLDSRKIAACCVKACEVHNQLIYNLLQLVATKNLVLHQKIRVTSRRSTREKLMEYLMGQAKERKSPVFTIPYDRQELADYLEVERSGLSAEISKLRREGILDCRKSTFRLLKPLQT